MSDTERTTGGWALPERTPGTDDLWDRLGERWQAIDGVVESGRIYVLWDWSEGRAHVSGLCISGAPVKAGTLRSIPISRLENLPYKATEAWVGREVSADLEPLVRSKGVDPEVFAEQVARYYKIFTQSASRPVKAMAEHSGVPVTTVRGWVREARLRGKLPPGTQGKAG